MYRFKQKITCEQSLRVFENRVQRRIFGSKRQEVKRGWRKLDNEELHKLQPSKLK
jgi:hypothetical protein